MSTLVQVGGGRERVLDTAASVSALETVAEMLKQSDSQCVNTVIRFAYVIRNADGVEVKRY